MNMAAVANLESLKLWVGAIPEHGKPLGVRETRWDICSLMSGRSADEIEVILDVLRNHFAVQEMSDFGFQLPPPGLNWELHGTALWRCVCLIPDDQRELPNQPENWEFVGAIALYCLKKAITALWREPIGLGQAPRVAGHTAQRLIGNARYWLLLAHKEKEAKFIQTGRKSRAAGEKGNRSRRKSDQKDARYLIIRKEAKEIRQKNPKLSNHAVAKRISKGHHNETGFRLSTIYGVIREEQKK